MSERRQPSAPRVAVIMPAYNSGRYITEAIASVVAQSYTQWELLVVDDGSTDDTGVLADRLAADYGTRVRVFHQPNAGIAGARNVALSNVDPSTDFIAFLDSDDVWFPTALSTMVEALQQAPDAVGVHGFRTYIDRRGDAILSNGATHAPLRRRSIDRGRLRTLAGEEPTTYEALAYGCCVFTGALLVRTAAVRAAGDFDSDAVPAEDWDMWLRLSLRGPFAFIQAPLYAYRLHGNNSTSDTLVKNRSLYFVRHKFAHDRDLPVAAREAMIAAFRWSEVYRATVCFRDVSRRVRSGSLAKAPSLMLQGFAHLCSTLMPWQRRLAALSGDRLR